MSDLKKPRKQRKSSQALQIKDLELNKETVADLTEGEAEHAEGGLRRGGEGEEVGGHQSIIIVCVTTKDSGCP